MIIAMENFPEFNLQIPISQLILLSDIDLLVIVIANATLASYYGTYKKEVDKCCDCNNDQCFAWKSKKMGNNHGNFSIKHNIDISVR